jgi:hypothetical protein
MQTKLITLSLVISILPWSSNAAVLIQHVSFAGGNNAGISGTAGTKFTVGASSISVSALGVQDVRVPSPPVSIEGPPPPTPAPDGMQVSHQIGLWTTTGVQIASVLVPAGTSATLTDTTWRYAELSQALVLMAGQTYVLGVHLTGGFDPITDNGLDPYAFAMSPNVTGVANVLSFGAFQMPVDVQQGGVPRWAPANLIYEVIPEPSACGLFGLGSLLLLRRSRQNRIERH